MSLPEPSAAPAQSIFTVPAHISAVLIGGGCGVSHIPQDGAVDCALCAPLAAAHIYPAAPESEQPAPASADAPSAPSPEVAAPIADAPAPKSRKAITPDDAAPSA